MNIFFNSMRTPFKSGQSLKEFLELRCEQGPYAVAVNETFVPSAHYASVTLNVDDRVELLSPMQGG